jgi:putative hydrolase of the HAD superfamily
VIRAVLFDLDDTLIDVTKSRQERAQRALTRLRSEGVKVGWGTFWNSINDLDEGGFYRRGMGRAIEDLGLHETPLGNECVGLWSFKGAEDLLTLSVGCADTLELLKPRYRLGVVTNGPMDTQRHKLEHAGLQDYFELFLPSGEVGVHKPDPQILQIALRRLGLRPYEAVFVGDHLDLDVICAHRAGMRGILYNPGLRRPRHPSIEPDAMIRSFDELAGVLEKWAD